MESDFAPQTGLPASNYEQAYLRESFKWTMAYGICLGIVGAIAIAVPFLFTKLSAVVIGVFLFTGGALRGVDIVRGKAKTATFARMMTSILYVLVGAMMIFSPLGPKALTIIVAVLFLAEGVGYLMMAGVAYPIPGWYWGIINGLLTMGLGGLILAGWPASANWAIGLLVGVNLLVGGLSIVAVSKKARDVIGAQNPAIVTMD